MKAKIKGNYPKELLRGKEVKVKNCREIDGETELYEYLISYKEPGMAINRWIEEKYIALS